MDFQRGTLKIQRAISRQDDKVTVSPMKTKNAHRTLPLSAEAMGVLYAQKKESCFTLDAYAHVTTDAQRKAAQTMGNLLAHHA